MVVLESGIVSLSSARWVQDRTTTTTFLLFSPTVVLSLTILVGCVFPLSTGLLSFFSVDQVQRTDFNGSSLATSGGPEYFHLQSSGERTMGKSEMKVRKTLRNFGRAQRRNNRGESGGDKGCVRKKESNQCSIDMNNQKGVEAPQEVRGRQTLTWEMVTILDEDELQDEVDTSRTRIQFLPDGRLFSSFLNRGMNGRFLLLNSLENGSISMVITPCNSIVVGTFSFLIPSSTASLTKFYVAFKRSQILETMRTQNTVTFKMAQAPRGIYVLELRPIYSSTYVHLLVTADPEFTHPFDPFTSTGSSPLHVNTFLNVHPSHTHLRPWIGLKRLSGSRLQIKWDRSPINPHRMHYCLVINTRSDYSSLCGAKADKFGLLPPDLRHLPIYPFYPTENEGQTVNASTTPSHEITAGCLKKKVSYIMTDLKDGVLYYVNVFVRDPLTGLSFPYVRTVLKHRLPKRSGNLIADAKARKVLLKDSPVTLEFNVKQPCGELTFYIIPCGGGTIDYKISAANRTLYNAVNVDGLDVVKMAFPNRAKYFVKVEPSAELRENENSARMAEVFVSKKLKKFPLPKLPAIASVTEVLSERRCDTVTIQWTPGLDPRDDEYCVFLKEQQDGDDSHFKKPNQCDVERSLQNDPRVSQSYCLQKTPEENRKFVTEKISGLKPSTYYVVQLILKRHNGKAALSYDLTQVITSRKCAKR